MRSQRISLGLLMIIVLIAAVDFGVVRFALRIASIRPRTEIVIFGTLPMANILAFGLIHVLRTARSRPFLIGFYAVGTTTLAVTATVLLAAPEDWLNAFDGSVFRILMSFPTYQSLRRDMDQFAYAKAAVVAIGVSVVFAAWTLPQLTIALAGGLLARRFGKRRMTFGSN